MNYDDEKIYIDVRPEDVPRFLTSGFKIEAANTICMSRSIAADLDANNVLRVVARDCGHKTGD